MFGKRKTKSRNSTDELSDESSLPNSVQAKLLSTNERILKECHSIYTKQGNGLIEIAENLGLEVQTPRKKVTLLLLGNHSAGKSTFINWYVEEHVQKTGVAIETQGFTVVTSGRKRESLKGSATLHLYPFLKPLLEINGVVDYLSTEISSSKHKNFPLLTFIDTPGLVDGDMVYPFDVNRALTWFGDQADLIFVFFDPMGQALCRRTLDIVEKLNEKHADRIKFFLTKADEAGGDEADRQRVLMQIVQELCKRPGLNRAGFDMPTIYIPDDSISKNTRCLNQIQNLCKEISHCIEQTVQNTLDSLENDCERIAKEVNRRIDEDSENRSHNWTSSWRGLLLSAWLLSGIFILMLYALFSLKITIDMADRFVGQSNRALVQYYLSFIDEFWGFIPSGWKIYFIGMKCVGAILLYFLAKRSFRFIPVMSRKHIKQLLEHKHFVEKDVTDAKRRLYQEYLDQCTEEQE